jgi:hypothetical protein
MRAKPIERKELIIEEANAKRSLNFKRSSNRFILNPQGFFESNIKKVDPDSAECDINSSP